MTAAEAKSAKLHKAAVAAVAETLTAMSKREPVKAKAKQTVKSKVSLLTSIRPLNVDAAWMQKINASSQRKTKGLSLPRMGSGGECG